MNLRYALPLVGRLYHQRDKARTERDAAIRQAGQAHNTGPFRLVQYQGLTLLMDTRNVLDRDMVNLGDFENAQLAYLTAQVKHLQKAGNAPWFFDIGAHWGLYSLMLQQAGVEVIHAYEADARNRAHAQAQMLLNGATEAIELHPEAVWSKSGTVQFATTTANAARDRGWAQIVSPETPPIEAKARKAVSLKTVKVPAISLDDAFPKLRGTPLIIKIDTEGAESQVLKGMSKIIASNPVLIQLENHPKNRSAFLQSLPKGLVVHHIIEPDLYLLNPAMQKLLAHV